MARRTLRSLDIDTAALPRLLVQCQRITHVFPGSPAEALGLQVGWLALLAGDAAPVASELERLRLEGAERYVFHNPANGRSFELGGGPWPLGIKLTGVGTQGFLSRIAVRSEVDDELFEAFGRGELDAFAQMKDAFRDALTPSFTATFAPVLGTARLDKAIAKSRDWHYLAFLALAHLAAGEPDRAAFFLSAVRGAIERSGRTSFSLLFTALLSFIDARLSWDGGNRDKGLALMQEALFDAPEYDVLRDTYATWSDSPPLIHAPQWVGDDAPLHYRFRQHDPLGFWPDGGMVSLADTLGRMGAEQVLIVVYMPGYRANYYYNRDVTTLAALHQHNPDRIAAVHVITDTDHVSFEPDRAQAEGAARSYGVPLALLFDEDAGLAEEIELYRSPTTLVLDRAGTVLANGVLSDESAYWEAVTRLSLQ